MKHVGVRPRPPRPFLSLPALPSLKRWLASKATSANPRRRKAVQSRCEGRVNRGTGRFQACYCVRHLLSEEHRPGIHLKGRGLRGSPRLDRRIEEVSEAVLGRYCRLQIPLNLAVAAKETVARHMLGALEGAGRPGGWWIPPPFNASLAWALSTLAPTNSLRLTSSACAEGAQC